MAFTAGYWALGALQPKVIAFLGCNMVYDSAGDTHFYGKGAPDPLRKDVSLRSLEAKSARMALIAAENGCRMVNLSAMKSRLVVPRATLATLRGDVPFALDKGALAEAKARETVLGYMVPSGRYWSEEGRFDTSEIDALDALWLRAWYG